jgi:hypothetical protein
MAGKGFFVFWRFEVEVHGALLKQVPRVDKRFGVCVEQDVCFFFASQYFVRSCRLIGL